MYFLAEEANRDMQSWRGGRLIDDGLSHIPHHLLRRYSPTKAENDLSFRRREGESLVPAFAGMTGGGGRDDGRVRAG